MIIKDNCILINVNQLINKIRINHYFISSVHNYDKVYSVPYRYIIL